MNLFPSSFPSFAKLQTTSRQLRKGEFPPEEKREERRAFSCPPPLSLRRCLSRQSLSPVYKSAHPPYFPSLAFEVHVEKWEGDEIPRLSLFMKVDSRPTSQLLTSSQTSNFLDIFLSNHRAAAERYGRFKNCTAIICRSAVLSFQR